MLSKQAPLGRYIGSKDCINSAVKPQRGDMLVANKYIFKQAPAGR